MIGIEKEKESVRVLYECIDTQILKGQDYQSDWSSVKQADYYRLGVDSIYDMMHTKMLRLLSLMEKAKAGTKPNFESLEDTAKDLINYASFYVAFLRKKVDGQDVDRDMFNQVTTDYSVPINDVGPVENIEPIVRETVAYISDPQKYAAEIDGGGLLNARYPKETIISKP